MEREELLESWRKTEDDIRAVLSRTRVGIPDEEARDVEEYLDHNELGLAWELLVEALVAHDASVSDADRKTLRRAAARMSMDLNLQPFWARLEERDE